MRVPTSLNCHRRTGLHIYQRLPTVRSRRCDAAERYGGGQEGTHPQTAGNDHKYAVGHYNEGAQAPCEALRAARSLSLKVRALVVIADYAAPRSADRGTLQSHMPGTRPPSFRSSTRHPHDSASDPGPLLDH